MNDVAFAGSGVAACTNRWLFIVIIPGCISGKMSVYLNSSQIINRSTGLTDTQVSTFIEARAALRAPPVHGPHTSPVRSLVADPVHTPTHTHQKVHHYLFVKKL